MRGGAYVGDTELLGRDLQDRGFEFRPFRFQMKSPPTLLVDYGRRPYRVLVCAVAYQRSYYTWSAVSTGMGDRLLAGRPTALHLGRQYPQEDGHPSHLGK